MRAVVADQHAPIGGKLIRQALNQRGLAAAADKGAYARSMPSALPSVMRRASQAPSAFSTATCSKSRRTSWDARAVRFKGGAGSAAELSARFEPMPAGQRPGCVHSAAKRV